MNGKMLTIGNQEWFRGEEKERNRITQNGHRRQLNTTRQSIAINDMKKAEIAKDVRQLKSSKVRAFFISSSPTALQC